MEKAVDGIGGNVKTKVWTCVKSRLYIVSNPNEVFDCAKEEIKAVSILFISTESILENEKIVYRARLTVSDVPGIQSNHFFRLYDMDHLIVAKTN